MRSVCSLAVRLQRHAYGTLPRPRLEQRRLPWTKCISFTARARANGRDVVYDDLADDHDDLPSADGSSIDDEAPFYDALFRSGDTQRPSKMREESETEHTSHGAAVEDEIKRPETMNVIMGGRGRLIRSVAVNLPDELYMPELGNNVPFQDYNETVFNRFSLPDDSVLAYDWEPMALYCAAQEQQWNASGREITELASYPGLAIPRAMPKISYRLTSDRSKATTALDVLDQEITQFNQDASTSFYEADSRRLLAAAFVRLLQQFLGPRQHVELYGSTTTGPMLPFSDVNIRVRKQELAHDVAPFSDGETIEAREQFSRMEQLLNAMTEVKNVHFFQEPIPEIEFVHHIARIKFRVTSYKTATRQERYLKRLRKDHSHFNELYRILRSTLHLRKLTNTRTGGVSSYTLRAMIAAWSGLGHVPETAAEQLLSFLTFWSSFDTSTHAISSQTGLFLKHPNHPRMASYRKAALRRGNSIRSAQWELCARRTPFPWLLCLQNPSFRLNDLGKYAYAIKHVLRTFQYLRIKLEKGMVAIDQGEPVYGNLLDAFVGAFGRSLAASKLLRRRAFEQVFEAARE